MPLASQLANPIERGKGPGERVVVSLGPQVSLLVEQILLCCLMGMPSPEVGL